LTGTGALWVSLPHVNERRWSPRSSHAVVFTWFPGCDHRAVLLPGAQRFRDSAFRRIERRSSIRRLLVGSVSQAPDGVVSRLGATFSSPRLSDAYALYATPINSESRLRYRLLPTSIATALQRTRAERCALTSGNAVDITKRCRVFDPSATPIRRVSGNTRTHVDNKKGLYFSNDLTFRVGYEKAD
jgi:hypothetical protein